MKALFILMLCAWALFAPAQGFSFRDPAWTGLISTPSGSQNNAVFNSAVHLWHLESTGTRPDTIGGISLLETGGQVNSAAGIHGNAADFQPVSQAGHYLVAGTTLTETDPESIAIWVKFRSLPVATTVSEIFELNPDGALHLYLDQTGLVNFQTDFDTSDITFALGSLNTWHLIVAVQDIFGTGNTSLSVDGGTFVTDIAQDIHTGNINTVALGTPNPLVPDALFDEPVIFSSALTQGNVTTLWNSGAGIFYSP